ncbi:class I SAM-dependent methyltransferase [Cognatiyoonia sp. IB215446]|uniref:class I SAM-dependent methyltransferase n=1 Tax=Cognatiyoonia sp. IB215446 TaxID=3097355 RepID=UPI002A0F55C7|nr:class I SAM-dependent methyltransferase [Cognatiyoonia sp. IB215446]MDX8349424.1 class I SAM-dependent methyltransferase [Cognatiyoonia sp. IB215446]
MGFSADWLALREPVDLAARDDALLARAAAFAGQDAVVLDLGSGTGSTARAFGDVRATWRFVDGDAALLDIAHARHPASECVTMNLRDIDDLPLDEVSLVTASALLDLMPTEWMTRLAARLQEAMIPFYAALNYDGAMRWSPALDVDATITHAFNQHQQTDKGIGPAMGPQSGQLAAQILRAHGFDVTLADSPWQLGAAEADLHAQLIAGIAEAAQECGSHQAPDWVTKRRADLARSHAVIGHTDLLAIPQKPH